MMHIDALRGQLWRLPPLPIALLAAWVLTMISIPILRWTVGDDALPWAVSAGVVLQAAAVLTTLHHAWGARQTLQAVALTLPLAWLVEFVGSKTGLPFGEYHYTELLRPQLGGVPLLIPLAWLMMLPPAWAAAQRIVGAGRNWRFVLCSAAAFTAWDFFLDPQMVGWGYWVWAQPGGYFGIPWVNFVGWFLSAALITGVVYAARWAATPTRPVEPPLPGLLLVIYTITWLLQSIGQLVFWGMPGPALAGFAVMGVFVGIAWYNQQ